MIGFFACLQQGMVSSICQAADKQLLMLVEWAKRIPHFTDLPKDDQVILLKSGTVILPIRVTVLTNAYALLHVIDCEVSTN